LTPLQLEARSRGRPDSTKITITKKLLFETEQERAFALWLSEA
jgi:hypothetical protein